MSNASPPAWGLGFLVVSLALTGCGVAAAPGRGPAGRPSGAPAEAADAPDAAAGWRCVTCSRALSLDFELDPRRGDDARSYLVTATVATYSDFLGGGQRRLGNPYLGLRFGGAKKNGHGVYAARVDVASDLLLRATLVVGIPF